MKTLFPVSLFLYTVLHSGAGFPQAEINGLIINNSATPFASRVVERLTSRWHFGHNAATSNLIIRDIDSSPTGGNIIFIYDNEIIQHHNLPKVDLQANNINELADDVYNKIVKIDLKKRRLVLDKLRNFR